MVAITVAIAATVYAYVSGMIGTGQKKTPNITFIPDNTRNVVTVASADSNIAWSDIVVTAVNTVSTTLTVTTDYTVPAGTVTAGQTISANAYLSLPAHAEDTVTFTLRYVPTNSHIRSSTVS